MNFETSIIQYLQIYQNPLFDFLGGFLSIFFIFWVLVGILTILYIWKKENAYFVTVIGMFSTGVIIQIIKEFAQKPRPELAIMPVYITHAYGYSFPSGHTAIAFVCASILSNYFPKYTKLIYTIATLVGISRLYLGVHYLMDVLVGALIGTMVAWIVIMKKKGAIKLEAKLNKVSKAFFKE